MSELPTGWVHRASAVEDIDEIWSNLADRLRHEFDIAERAFSWLDIRENAKLMAEDGHSRSYLKDGKLMVAMGWQPVSHGYATTFIAVEDYFKPNLSDIRYSRRSIEALQAELGNAKLVANSYGPHPALASWFKAMGYEQQLSDADYKVFVRWPRVIDEPCPCMAPFSISIGS
jgi:hypothetical protein